MAEHTPSSSGRAGHARNGQIGSPPTWRGSPPAGALMRASAKRSTSVSSIDHLELAVGNAFQTAHFFRDVFGLAVARQPVSGANDGPGQAFALGTGSATLVVATGFGGSELSRFVERHGEGVRTIGLNVSECAQAFDQAVRAGAESLQQPTRVQLDGGAIVAMVGSVGSLRIRFVERRTPGSPQPSGRIARSADNLFIGIDHIALALPMGGVASFAEFCRAGLGFNCSSELVTTTPTSGMRSVVASNPGRNVHLTLLEAIDGESPSQVQGFVDFNGGPGVQHIALATEDIIRASRHIRDRGLRLLGMDETHYTEGVVRAIGHDVSVSELAQLGVLFDSDEHGHLLQCFTAPLGSRPTLFAEVIERRGALGFGGANVEALFRAVEREQRNRDDAHMT